MESEGTYIDSTEENNNVDVNDLDDLDRERCSWSSDSCQAIARFVEERLIRIECSQP